MPQGRGALRLFSPLPIRQHVPSQSQRRLEFAFPGALSPVKTPLLMRVGGCAAWGCAWATRSTVLHYFAVAPAPFARLVDGVTGGEDHGEATGVQPMAVDVAEGSGE